MLKISMKVDYGVRALVDLAQQPPEATVRTSEIASRQAIPEPYLDQVLTILRRAGLIRSWRGPQGGHSLARPASEIRLNEVISALEGSIAPLSCVEESQDCTRSSDCAQREIWVSVQQAIYDVLKAITIEELAQRQRRREGRTMYHI